jgi:hypothetical protein
MDYCPRRLRDVRMKSSIMNLHNQTAETRAATGSLQGRAAGAQ